MAFKAPPVRVGAPKHSALRWRGHKLIEYETESDYEGALEDEAIALGEKKLAALLQKMRKPIGVCALNDKFACAVCVLCESLGLPIPEQVKVLGVGDMVIARTHLPALSSICTPGEEIGYLAMRALHKLLDGKFSGGRGVPKVTQVPATELVARPSTVGELPANGNFHAAIDYIARHACSNLTVEQLAAAMGITKRSLERRFQQVVGHAPSHEIQRVRLAKAQDLLQKTNLSVSRITAMVGFQETGAFSKFFTKQLGMSPLAYRKKRK